ncbi:UNVERIFIED_CONTAM: hypothetical protein Sradi_0001700 [Sesamum radiatum]|uniref:Uncharacterized protein n=1 Tax=Sesamum radiatum TaxID=300843 RepID=A0AAW2WGT3_SESRA
MAFPPSRWWVEMDSPSSSDGCGCLFRTLTNPAPNDPTSPSAHTSIPGNAVREELPTDLTSKQVYASGKPLNPYLIGFWWIIYGKKSVQKT